MSRLLAKLEDRLARVTVLDGAGNVSVDVVSFDDHSAGVEMHVSELSEEVRGKLAVLQMRSYDPPTEVVHGIGRRIDRDTFWVFLDRSVYGDDAGKAGEEAGG